MKKMKNQILITNLNEMRNAVGSIEELGKIANQPTYTMRRYLKGENKIGIETLIRLSNYFNITLDDLCKKKIIIDKKYEAKTN